MLHVFKRSSQKLYGPKQDEELGTTKSSGIRADHQVLLARCIVGMCDGLDTYLDFGGRQMHEEERRNLSEGSYTKERKGNEKITLRLGE
jgi:hypothetical protein